LWDGRVYNDGVIGAITLAVGVLVSARFGPSTDPALHATLSRLAQQTPGVVGISVLHIESAVSAAVNGDQRFPMMSVYKLPIAIHALREVDAKRLNLDESITLTAVDRRPGFSPIAERIAARGPLTMTIRDVLSDVVTRSDNTASDWLLRRIGGPRAVAATLQALAIVGVDVSRYELEFAADYYGLCCVADLKPFSLDRFADAVEQVPEAARRRAAKAYESDPRDAATPSGYTALLARLHRGELLSAASTSWLLERMREMHARDGRIRAGLPSGTIVALRPGTSGTTGGIRAAHNDTAIVTLPGNRGHLAIAVFLKGTSGTDDTRDAAIARIARAAYAWAVAR
jgi:beta-lactamase class A